MTVACSASTWMTTSVPADRPAAGQSGGSHALGILSAELEVAMALSGAASVQQLRGRAEVDTAR